MGHDLSVSLICALHGFLGEGSDWSRVKANLDQHQWLCPNLFSPGAKFDLTFSEVQKFAGKKIFVGYSLGGRIGLSLLEKRPLTFDHYIFVSVNPGFTEEDKASREDRWRSDLEWSQKVSESNWESFTKFWNEQKVFAGSQIEPKRTFENYDLNSLRDSLLQWSLAKQPDRTPAIKANKDRVTWVVGSRDEKFVSIAEKMKSDLVIDSYYKTESGTEFLSIAQKS